MSVVTTQAGVTSPQALGITASPTFKSLILTAGILTTSLPAIDATQTWNDGAVTFTGLKLNITDTASAAASLLADLQVGGVTKFSVSKAGHVLGASAALGGATIGTHALAVTGTADISSILGVGGLRSGPTGYSVWSTSAGVGTPKIAFDQISAGTAGIIYVSSDSIIGFNSATSLLSGGVDTAFSRISAGVIGVGTGAAGSVAGTISAATVLTTRETLTAGTLTSGTNAFALTATQPSTPSGTQTGVQFTITSAGSASQVTIGMGITYAAGYTGSSLTIGANLVNSVAGTGSVFVGAGNPTGNIGFAGAASATTAGYNVGTLGVGHNGNMNTGVYGLSIATKNSATNIGVVGAGLNTGTTPVQIGGWFALAGAGYSAPTSSAALIADNGAQTDPIARFQSAGVDMILIDDTGFIEGKEQTAPSAPAANGYRIFAQDNGAAKTQLMVIFASGAAQQIAIEP